MARSAGRRPTARYGSRNCGRPRAPGEPGTLKLPATLALGDRLPPLPEVPAPLGPGDGPRTWSDIRYREDGPAGFLEFSFPGGAMSTGHCRRLLAAYRHACARPTSVLVLGGRRDFFSNGIHLHVIEAAADPAEESWANINAMDDLVHAVLTTTDRLVVAALGGNAAAGGAMLALAADEVWCRSAVVLNPHYRLMGLYGSEYWTYTPARPGRPRGGRAAHRPCPADDRRGRCAARPGRPDHRLRPRRTSPRRPPGSPPGWRRRPRPRPVSPRRRPPRERDEAERPLAAHREHELDRMHRIFFDPDAPYHALRRAFVRKEPAAATPSHLNSPPVGT